MCYYVNFHNLGLTDAVFICVDAHFKQQLTWLRMYRCVMSCNIQRKFCFFFRFKPHVWQKRAFAGRNPTLLLSGTKLQSEPIVVIFASEHALCGLWGVMSRALDLFVDFGAIYIVCLFTWLPPTPLTSIFLYTYFPLLIYFLAYIFP